MIHFFPSVYFDLLGDRYCCYDYHYTLLCNEAVIRGGHGRFVCMCIKIIYGESLMFCRVHKTVTGVGHTRLEV